MDSFWIDYEAAEQGIITRCDDAKAQHEWVKSAQSLKIWEDTLKDAAKRAESLQQDGYSPDKLLSYLRAAKQRFNAV